MARPFKELRKRINEVINPRSEQDKAFFAVHGTQTKDYPVDADSQFKSDKAQGKRISDKETNTMAEKNVLKDLRDIVKRKGMKTIKFDDGDETPVDLMTASAITKVYDAVNPANQRKLEKMLNKDVSSFMKMVDFAFKQVK